MNTRWLHAPVALVFLTTQAPSAAPDADPPPLAIRLPQPPDAAQPTPLVSWSETRVRPRPLRLHFVRVNLRDPRVKTCVLIGDDPDGAGPAEAVLTKPGHLAKSTPGLLAAVNANAFARLPTATPAERKRGWVAGQAVDIQGLAAADGQIRSASQKGRVPFWFDAERQAHVGPPQAGERIDHGVADWGELLVSGGKPLPKPSPTLHPRTLAGIDRERQWLWLVVADGRHPGTSEGLSLPEAAELMRACGCSEAINLDGGGSSILLFRSSAQMEFATINRPSDGSPRPVPVLLGVRVEDARGPNPAR